MTDFKTSLKTILVLTCTSLNRCIYHTIIMSYHRQCSSESEGSSLLFKSTIFLNFLFKISTESYRKTIGSSAFSPVPSLSNTMMRAGINQPLRQRRGILTSKLKLG